MCAVCYILCNWTSTYRALSAYWNAYEELEVTYQMTQCEVFPVRAEQAPGETSLSSICVLESARLTSHLTCSDLLIVVLNSPLRLERASARASEAAQQRQTAVTPSLACAHTYSMLSVCVRLCAWACACVTAANRSLGDKEPLVLVPLSHSHLLCILSLSFFSS